MAPQISFEFSTSAYQLSHGRQPRGRGGWAFNYSGGGTDPIWAPPSSYADAKTWIKQHIRALAPAGFRGSIVVTVLT